jgi:hypothetical protein
MSEAGNWLYRFFRRFEPPPGESRSTLREERDEMLWETCFTPEQITGLGDALDVLEQAYGSRASRKLERAISPERWGQTRSAISGLRREGRAALHTTATATAWLLLSLQTPDPNDYNAYGQREVCFFLADMRLELDLARIDDGGSVDASLARLLRFFDEVVEQIIIGILDTAPIARVHRGAINYIRRVPLHDLKGVVDALEFHIDQPLTDVDDNDYSYGQVDALRCFQELSSREAGVDAARQDVARQNAENANPPPGYFTPSLTDIQLIENLLEVAEDERRPQNVREAALHLIEQLELDQGD